MGYHSDHFRDATVLVKTVKPVLYETVLSSRLVLSNPSRGFQNCLAVLRFLFRTVLRLFGTILGRFTDSFGTVSTVFEVYFLLLLHLTDDSDREVPNRQRTMLQVLIVKILWLVWL